MTVDPWEEHCNLVLKELDRLSSCIAALEAFKNKAMIGILGACITIIGALLVSHIAQG